MEEYEIRFRGSKYEINRLIKKLNPSNYSSETYIKLFNDNGDRAIYSLNGELIGENSKTLKEFEFVSINNNLAAKICKSIEYINPEKEKYTKCGIYSRISFQYELGWRMDITICLTKMFKYTENSNEVNMDTYDLIELTNLNVEPIIDFEDVKLIKNIIIPELECIDDNYKNTFNSNNLRNIFG
jgi:hypothetical protein